MSGVEEAANPSTPAGSFESNVIRNLQRSLAEVQKRTFTKWVNSHLGKVGSKIDDLHADFRDGKKLITLLEVISGEKLPKPDRGNMRIHMVNNVSKALKFLGTKVQLENIGVEDIVDGNEKLTMGMIWIMILRFQIQDISVDELSAKDALLLWCQKKTAGYPGVNVKDFTKSWQDGLAFNALIHKHRPDLLSFDNLSGDRNNWIPNLNQAFDIADGIGISKLLEAEDLANVERPDERSVMTYVAAYYHAFASQRKGDIAARRVQKLLEQMEEIDRLKTEYERLASLLEEWIKKKKTWLGAKELAATVEGIQQKFVEFKGYRTSEKPPKFSEKSNLEATYLSLQAKLRAANRPLYTPPDSKLVSTIDREWKGLERLEYEYEAALRAELERLEKLELLNQRFQRKIALQEKWVADEEVLLANTDESSVPPNDASAVNALAKKLEAIESDVDAHSDRIAKVADLASQLASQGHSLGANSASRAGDLSDRFEKIKAELARKKKHIAAFQDVSSFHQTADGIERWLLERKRVLSVQYVPPKDAAVAESQSAKHSLLETELEAYADRVTQLADRADEVARANPDAAQDVLSRSEQLAKTRDEVLALAAARKDEIAGALAALRAIEDIDEEKDWIRDRVPRASSTDYGVGKDSAVVAQLVKKHNALLEEIASHEPVVKNVSDAAQEIIASGHPLSGDIQASLADLESQWAGLKAAAEERRARLAESASLAAFEKEAEDIDGWIKSKEPATDAPLGDDLASVRRALDAQEALDAEVAKFASTVSGLGKLKDKLSGDQPQSSDQLEKRYGKVLASWNHLLEAVRDRSEKLKELQAKLYGVEALLMEFAKLASAFNTWLEGAQEDLVDEVKSSSLDEIVTLRNAHLAFMDSLAGPAADIEKLKAVQGDIEAAGVQHNPYTPFSIDSLNSRWNSVLDLVDDRSDRLDKELARQEANEALRVEFAEKANAFAAWVSATRAIVTETGSSLAEQLALIRTKKGEIQNKRSDLQDIEDVSAKLEDALVLYNPHTEQTTTGISQEWQGLDQLAKRMEHNLEQQIAATQKSGVPEETLREYTEIFNHYDRDRNGSLDHVEFKSCLRALGYNLPVLAEGVTDAEYEAILAYVDPNRNGHVTRDDFIAFMISQSTEKAETADDLIEAFKTIAGEKSTVTEAELRSYLSKEQADYLLEKLKGFEAGAGQYDYEAWSRQNVPDSGAGAKRFNPASAAAAARN